MSDEFEPEAPNEGSSAEIDVDAFLKTTEVRLQGFDAWATGEALKMDPSRIRMGINLLAGMNQTAAAKAAGFAGEGNALRSAASKAANSNSMRAFLKAAEEYKAGVSDLPLSDKEKLQILARNARASNPAIQTRAVLAHAQLEREQNAGVEPVSPEDTYNELQNLVGKELADVIAAAVGGGSTNSIEDIAMGWIRDNPDRAKQVAEFWLRPSTSTNAIQFINPNGEMND